MGPLIDLIPAVVRVFPGALVDAFRTGGGIPYADYALHDAQGDFNRPAFLNLLASEWLPSIPGLSDRLAAGQARVAEIGCGEGWAAIGLAKAWPQVEVDGFDNDEASIAAARKHAAEAGVGDRVRFEVVDVTRDLPEGVQTAGYDLVMAFEMVHDLARPVEALATMRRLAKPDAVVLVADEKVAFAFEAPSDDPVERLLYAASVLHCLPVGRAESPSAATGTVMRPATLTAYAEAAGFSTRRDPADRPRLPALLPARRLIGAGRAGRVPGALPATSAEKAAEEVAQAAALPTEQPAQDVAEPSAAERRVALAAGRFRRLRGSARHPLGQPRHHDRREDRQQLGDQPAPVAGATQPAETAQPVDDLRALLAEHVLHDLVAVVGVDVQQVDVVLQLKAVLAERLAQGGRPRGIVSIGLHARDQRGEGAAHCALGLLAVHAERPGHLVHRDLRHEVVEVVHVVLRLSRVWPVGEHHSLVAAASMRRYW